MNDLEDRQRRLTPPRRNHYFYGKMMGVAQFEREQRYELGKRQLLNRLTIGSGVLCGLELQVAEDQRSFGIASGVALDAFGREIVVARPLAAFNPFAERGGACGCGDVAPITAAGVYQICLSYRECLGDEVPAPAEDCSCEPDCQPDSLVETYSVSLRPVADEPELDCAWSEPVTTRDDSGRTTAEPPSIALLRERLGQTFAGGCQPTTNGCVPLGTVHVAEHDGALVISKLDARTRVRVYSQTQLLDMILCLARCCGEHDGGTPPDVVAPTTLVVSKVEVVAPRLVTGATAVAFTGLTPLVGSHPPLFFVHRKVPLQAPLAVRVTFNQALDASSLPDPIAGAVASSISVQRNTVAAACFAVLEQPNTVLIFIAGGDTSAHTGMLEALGKTTSFLAPLTPGRYSLTLHGTTSGGHSLIKSWPPGSAQASLDGEWADPDRFLAANETSGPAKLDFKVNFEVRPTLSLFGLKTGIGSFVDVDTPLAVQWTAEGITIDLEFNLIVDEDTLKTGIALALPGGAAVRPKAVVSAGNNTNFQIVFATQENGLAQPAAPYELTVSMTGDGAEGIKELAAGGAFGFDGDAQADDNPATLPTGNGVPGGSFTFTLSVQA